MKTQPTDISKETIKVRLENLKNIYDQGLIEKDEYNKKRQLIIDEL